MNNAMESWTGKVLATVLVAMTHCAAAQVWEQGQGTEGLNLQAIIATEGAVVTGGATGTYRSTDGGAEYVGANTGNTSIGPTRGFTQGGDYLYKCTSNGAFRSADDGASWTSVSDGLPQLLCHGMAYASGVVWVVTPTGVYNSDDQGEAWSAAGLAGLDVRCISLDGGYAYVGTQGDGLFRSADGGQSWESINNGSTSSSFRAIEAHNGVLYAGGQIGTGVFRSTDGGNSWVLLDNGIPAGSYRGFAAQGAWIAAGSFGGGVYISSDDGDSWMAINEGLEDEKIFDLEFSETHLLAATNEAGAWRVPIAELGAPASVMSMMSDAERMAPWPNPCAEVLHVAGHPGTPFTVTDELGRTVVSGRLNGTALDVSNWPRGIVHVQMGHGGERWPVVVVPH